MRVERTADRRRQSLQGIESGEDQLTKLIVASRQHCRGLAGPQQMPGVTDRVRAGGTGIGDDRDRATEAECLGQIHSLSLRLVMTDARGLLAERAGLADRLSIKNFAQTHTPAGGAKTDWQILR